MSDGYQLARTAAIGVLHGYLRSLAAWRHAEDLCSLVRGTPPRRWPGELPGSELERIAP